MNTSTELSVARMLVPESLKGPLGSHTSYIRHIALRNFLAYEALKREHDGSPTRNVAAKYEEFRLFLNAIESANNILDYFYFENELALHLKRSTVRGFRKAVHAKFAELHALADLANAYKHCVRTDTKGAKNSKIPWAKDLQRPTLSVTVDIAGHAAPKVDVEYNFEWPIQGHDKVLKTALDFWVQHLQASRASELIHA